jgi:hypothetical protein
VHVPRNIPGAGADLRIAFPLALSLSDRQNDGKMLSRRAVITWKRPKGASLYSTYSFLAMIGNILLVELF